MRASKPAPAIRKKGSPLTSPPRTSISEPSSSTSATLRARRLQADLVAEHVAGAERNDADGKSASGGSRGNGAECAVAACGYNGIAAALPRQL